MENPALPYVAMVASQFAQVGLLITSKGAILSGMSTFTFTFYSSVISALILLPSSFLVYRSNRPPISLDLLSWCFLIGLLGFLSQAVGMAGTVYASASLASAIINLIPGFTFFFAVLFRLEMVDFRRFSTMAKTIGTVVGILGALVATLYRGPSLLMIPSNSSQNLILYSLKESSNWALGGILLVICCVIASLLIIAEAFALKKYPVELMIMFFYSCFVTVFAAVASLVMDRSFDPWRLNSETRLLGVVFAGLFGNVFQVTIGAWCVRKRGPFFTASFHPLGIVIATTMGVIFLDDIFYLGSLIGSVIIVVGFYSVMWGKAKENTVVDEKAPLLFSKDDNVVR